MHKDICIFISNSIKRGALAIKRPAIKLYHSH